MQKKVINVVGGSILILAFIYSFYNSHRHVDDLRKERIITNAIVTGTKTGKSNRFITYRFNYKKGTFDESKGASPFSFSEINRFLVGKPFPLIVSKTDMAVNDLLITKSDFEKYNLAYPDSLKWLCDSLKLSECK